MISCQAGEGGLAWAEQFPSSLLDDQGNLTFLCLNNDSN
jgi:hypothetical protein